MTDAIKYPENFDKYPQNVKDIIEKDILTRGEDDPVRIAYNVSLQLHKGQKRKGIFKPDYITHPLQVYDLVKKCIESKCVGSEKFPDLDVTLVAALLHDGIEDYKKDDVKKYMALISAGMDPKDAGVNPYVAHEEAENIIKEAFSDRKFADKLLKLVHEVTNPAEFTDEVGKEISKIEWQVKKIKNVSTNAKLIKICDKTMSTVSNIEEVPNWRYKKLGDNIKESVAVVNAAQENVEKSDRYFPAVEHAAKIFNLVARGSKQILKGMKSDGIKAPPEHQVASFSLKIIEEMIETKNTKNKQNKTLGR